MAKFEKHVYDVDLKEVYRQYQDGMNNVEIISANSKQFHIEHFKKNIEFYCESFDINFDLSPMIILKSENGPPFWIYLSGFLIFYRVDKINLLLDYHYKKNTGDNSVFINQMEFVVLDHVKRESLFDNSKRLDKISKWIEYKKRIFKKAVIRPKWDTSNLSFLKKISESLFREHYTKRKMDFYDVFFSGKIITWKKSPESLIYLINKLTIPPNNYIKSAGIDRSYIKAAEGHFKFYDQENELVHRNDLKNVLYNVTKRSYPAHTETRNSIDEIIRKSKSNLV